MKAGDYVRNNKGNIAKIIEVERKNNWLTVRYDNVFNNATGITYNLMNFKNEEEILEYNHIKSRPDIIDLIERFDLVNGHLVICKMYENEKDIPTIVKCVGEYYFKEEDIKSIVTREMFESMEYKVGDQ